ncbi:MAG: helix-turn-helix domain-containing protein, partial [Nitrospira sp.]|nr:helix-turn-helix domain-containing protein [Nitrospira sp.]
MSDNRRQLTPVLTNICKISSRIPIILNSDFLSRAKVLLMGRKPYSWGMALGLGRGTISRMFNDGLPPAADALAIIARAENVSITWLLTGRGEPRIVYHYPDDASALEHIDADLLDENWQVLLVSATGCAPVVVLHQPAQFVTGADTDKTVDYILVETITGAGRASLLRCLDAGAQHVQVDVDYWHSLSCGEIAPAQLMA